MDISVFQITWFVLWAVLWAAYFMLDGFVLGTGFLSGIIAKNDTEKRILINSIGPVWDGKPPLPGQDRVKTAASRPNRAEMPSDFHD